MIAFKQNIDSETIADEVNMAVLKYMIMPRGEFNKILKDEKARDQLSVLDNNAIDMILNMREQLEL